MWDDLDTDDTEESREFRGRDEVERVPEEPLRLNDDFHYVHVSPNEPENEMVIEEDGLRALA
jgi:hypothetical protein